MVLSSVQALIIVLAVTAGTIITRFLPFLLFPDNKKPPQYITYLGQVLPAAVIGLLVIYCLKEVNFMTKPYGIPSLVSVLAVVLLHIWKRNTLISIAGGTILYMVFVQVIFK